MISAGGLTPNTIPVVYLEDLLYRPDGGDEVVWGSSVFVSGDPQFYFLRWLESTEPVVHGQAGDPLSLQTWWAASANELLGSIPNRLWHTTVQAPDSGASEDASESLGELAGGMDNLVIYRPNDLWKRVQASGMDFGETVEVQDESFALTTDTRYMDEAATSSKVFIHCLAVDRETIPQIVLAQALPTL